MYKYVVIILLVIPFFSKAQLLEPDEKTRIGIRAGFGWSTVLGGEFQKPLPYFGFLTGITTKTKLTPKINLYVEIAGRFKGSKFNFNSDSSSYYKKLALLYAELPIIAMYDISKENTKNKKYICIGLQPSLLIKSNIYTGTNALPYNRDTVKNFEFYKLPLKNFDLNVCAGIQWDYNKIGIQILAKYGLVDLNKRQWGYYRNVNYSRLKPAFTNIKSIHLLSLEFGILF